MSLQTREHVEGGREGSIKRGRERRWREVNCGFGTGKKESIKGARAGN